MAFILERPEMDNREDKLCDNKKYMVNNKTSDEKIINLCNERNLKYSGRFIKNHQTWVKFICPIHESKGSQEKSWDKFKRNGCKFCARKKAEEKKCLTIIDVKRKINNNNIDICDIYFNDLKNEREFSFICKIHESYGIQTHNLFNLDRIKTPCKYCHTNLRSNIEKLNKSINEFNKTIFVYGEYINNKTPVHCKCLICNSEWMATPDNLLNEKSGCPVCKKSKGEMKISNYLVKNKISAIAQYTFDDCRNIKPLPFDFYIPKYNICIEYQGIQHYNPTNFQDRKDVNLSNKMFERVKINDSIKKEYCKQNGIKLIEIPYWEFNNIENILKNKIGGNLLIA